MANLSTTFTALRQLCRLSIPKQPEHRGFHLMLTKIPSPQFLNIRVSYCSSTSEKDEFTVGISKKTQTSGSAEKQLKDKVVTDSDIEKILKDIEELEQLRSKIHSERKRQQSVDKTSFQISDPEIGEKEKRQLVSDVECGGCGVHLHCTDSSIPGYVPRELFTNISTKKLPELLCQRCVFLNLHNKVLHQEVDKNVYKKILKNIRKYSSLVIMLVDVTDIANSVVHDTLTKLRASTPVVLVGNKFDLIPQDSNGYISRVLHRMEGECLKYSPKSAGRVIHSCVISAKTGYGVEALIDFLFNKYFDYEEVYLVGMTNSGKSTLFNLFLNSDYCKHSCRDIIQRATVSRWPGTTLDLIKFPILRPEKHYIAKRQARLAEQRVLDKEKKTKYLSRDSGKSKHRVVFETVGKTEFRSKDQLKEIEKKMAVTGNQFAGYSLQSLENIESESLRDQMSYYIPRKTVMKEDYPGSRWVFDTPGLINNKQVITKLTVAELKKMLNIIMIRPRVFVMAPGDTMFVTGLGRIDYIKGIPNTLFTVNINHLLPVHVLKTQEADEFYAENIGTEVLGVPLGDQERLNKLPSLCGREFTVYTEDNNRASSDIQLSSLGWVSVAAKTSCVEVRAFTPGGLGMNLRTPALLPNILTFKGTRIASQKAYRMKKLKR